MKTNHGIDENCVSQTENCSGSVLQTSDLLTDGSGDLQAKQCHMFITSQRASQRTGPSVKEHEVDGLNYVVILTL